MNLYVHFPFCRAKCAYCALLSRAGTDPATRAAYVARLVRELTQVLGDRPPVVPSGDSPRAVAIGDSPRAVAIGDSPRAVAIGDRPLETIYFGGGTPALCDLSPIFAALRPYRAPTTEFTVELHPQDVTAATLDALAAGGVNRISLGVQSFDDAALAAMGRGHTADAAEDAFRRIQARFPNSGLDLIAGWPGTDPASWQQTVARALALGPVHISCYTLIREPLTRLDRDVRHGRVTLPDDDAALTQLDVARDAFAAAGLVRYEVSNYARPGFACRHNAAVWRGEDYVGLGEGAHGRLGLRRMVGRREGGWDEETVTPEADAFERATLGLRTAAGINLAEVVRTFPILAPRVDTWRATLRLLVEEGILASPTPDRFVPTSRGFEVCDAILAEL